LRLKTLLFHSVRGIRCSLANNSSIDLQEDSWLQV
jgi:hypothetical protein